MNTTRPLVFRPAGLLDVTSRVQRGRASADEYRFPSRHGDKPSVADSSDPIAYSSLLRHRQFAWTVPLAAVGLCHLQRRPR